MNKLQVSFFVSMCLLLIGLQQKVYAQQDAQYTEYMFNSMAYNPAYAGSTDALSFTALGRKQWVNIDGAPETATFSVHSPFRDKYGIGLSLVHDRIGIHKFTTANLSYSYRFYLSPTAKLSVGLQGGATYQMADYAMIAGQTGDVTFTGEPKQILPNFGVGIYYYNKNGYVGLSVPQLLNNKLADSSDRLARQYRHYFLAAGIVLPIGESLKLKPSVLVKAVPAAAPMEADLNATLFIRDIIWVGATYRTGASVDLLFGIQISPALRIGYAYDLITTDLTDHTTGSHEVMIGFDHGGFNSQKIVTPRYF